MQIRDHGVTIRAANISEWSSKLGCMGLPWQGDGIREEILVALKFSPGTPISPLRYQSLLANSRAVPKRVRVLRAPVELLEQPFLFSSTIRNLDPCLACVRAPDLKSRSLLRARRPPCFACQFSPLCSSCTQRYLDCVATSIIFLKEPIEQNY